MFLKYENHFFAPDLLYMDFFKKRAKIYIIDLHKLNTLYSSLDVRSGKEICHTFLLVLKICNSGVPNTFVPKIILCGFLLTAGSFSVSGCEEI